MKKSNNLWNRASSFFEHGDLVPFAVIISIWHFAKALIAQGENVGVAVASGIFVDMLHFRTVRYAVNRRSKNAVLVAMLTTGMSYGFHLLFYTADGFEVIDLLLAIPLPVGIPILAWQQTAKAQPLAVERWIKRAKLLLKIGKGYRNRS